MEPDITSNESRPFVRETCGRIMAALAPVRSSAPYALVDYPNYANAGDAAIWLGTVRLLRALNGREAAYTSTLTGFSPEACRNAIGTGTIYLLGGGNFGDLYLKHHGARLKLIAAMPANPLVQLPMSLAAGDTGAAINEATRRICAAHPALSVFAREEMTRDALERQFGIAATLCPDLAFGMSLPPRAAQRGGIVAILRNDIEKRAPGTLAAGSGVTVTDWTTDTGMRRANRRGKLALKLTPRAWLLARQTAVARRKVDIAANLIGNAGAIVTDRLHAHILAVMLGIPCAAIDNSTGKVAAYLACWTGGLDGAALARSTSEALDIARGMAGAEHA